MLQTTMMDNINLTDDGIAFSLDDFGTGYSNMKRIASMPFSIVKLDKTFADIDTDDKMIKGCQDTISMVKDMNMKIVVEGVETEEESLGSSSWSGLHSGAIISQTIATG